MRAPGTAREALRVVAFAGAHPATDPNTTEFMLMIQTTIVIEDDIETGDVRGVYKSQTARETTSTIKDDDVIR